MPEAVGRHRELNRNHRIALGVLQTSVMRIVKLRSARQDLIDSFLADRQRKKFMNDYPLVMPANEALRHFEDLVGRKVADSWFSAQMIDDRIVKPQHSQVQLTDDDVFIVPAVANDGVVIGITGKIRLQNREWAPP
jgi:hypothetical protein